MNCPHDKPYKSKCKLCVAAYQKIYRQENKESKSTYNKVYRESNKNELIEYTRNWRKVNPLYYKKRSPASARHNTMSRKAAKLQRTPKWLTPLNIQQIKMFYESAAALTKELGVEMQVDHIVPLQGKNVSGLHVPWNLQVLSKSENCRKNNRL